MLTFDELVLMNSVAQQAAAINAPNIMFDVSQGVFTQAVIDDLVMREDRVAFFPALQNNMRLLVADLQADGNIAIAPDPFTPDEMTAMNFLLQHVGTYSTQLIEGALHVGFWSDNQLARLDATITTHQTNPQVLKAVGDLVAEELAGNQLLHSETPITPGITGIHFDLQH